jgi:hypothetical protein
LVLYGTIPFGISFGAVAGFRSGAPYDRLLFNPDLFSYIEEIRADPRGEAYRHDNKLTIDFRAEKDFPFAGRYLSLFIEVFNLINSGAVTERFLPDGPRFGQPLARMESRTVRLGLRYHF